MKDLALGSCGVNVFDANTLEPIGWLSQNLVAREPRGCGASHGKRLSERAHSRTHQVPREAFQNLFKHS
jgi:hypothetical protein